MKKILLFLSFLLMSIGVWGVDVTFSPSTCTNWSSSQTSQTQTINGVTLQSSKGANNTQLRLYAGSTLTISSTNTITKIIFNCTASGTAQYGPGNISGTGYSYSGNAGTWTGSSNSISLSVDAQTRCNSIVATYSGGSTTYTVTYDANGGSGTMTDTGSPYNSGVTVTTLSNTFTKSGYIFSKWNTAANGGGINYNEGATFTINANTTLYAQWIEDTPIDSDCGVFHETWDGTTGTGGNDGSWGGNIASNTIYSDNSDWAYSNSGGANYCVKIGAGSKKGSAETPAINYNESRDLILTFKAGAWDGSSENLTVNLSATNATISQSSITLVKGSWTTYTINLTNVSNNFKIKWEASTASNNRFFLDDICISEDETCLPTISITKIEQGGTFDLSSDSVCENGSVTLSNITPSEGYKFDTIICLAQEGEEFVEHGTVNVSNSTISGITKDCYVIVIFSQLPPEPEIEIVEWNPDYIKVDIDNFDAVTAVIENKNTQEVHENNVATELFFSKYFEAETTIKMLGIYNGKQDSLNLSDYTIKAGDGTKGTSWVKTYNLSNLGWIHSGEEIILYSYSEDVSTNSVVECINSHGAGFSKYIRVKTGGLVDGSLTFNGDDAIGLFKNDKLIDIIGAGTSEVICVTGLKGKTNGKDTTMYETHIIDNYCWITDTADNTNGYSNVIATDLCLLIRKSNVHSGDSAVKYNTTDFVTLGSEWFGKLVSKKDSSTCKNFDYVSSFDYNEHYSQYTQISESITLESVPHDDGSYKISIPDLDTLSCTMLKVIVSDNSNKSEECEYKIPIFVTENTNSNSLLFSQEGEDCPECDVVIINGGKLTVNSELTNRDVTVYPGGVLVIPDGKIYNVNSLTLRRDNDSIPYFSYKGTLNLTDKFYIDLRTNSEDWRWMSLPFSHKVSDIKQSNGKPINLNNNVWVSYYDGKYRSINEKNAWKDVITDTTFNAGQGFLFGVYLPGQSKKIYRFSFNKSVLSQEKEDKTINGLRAWGGNNKNLAPNHKGWNLIGNPFMDNDTTEIFNPIRIGKLVKDTLSGYWNGGWIVDSITDKLRYGVFPVMDRSKWTDEIASAGGYESKLLDDVELKPLTSFFVQIGGKEETIQGITFKTKKRINRIVARNPMPEDDDELFLRIKVGELKTGCFISNKFTDEYEPGDDLESRYSIYQSIAGYKLLYSAVNDSIIERGIVITSPAGNLHLDEKVDVDKFEYIYVNYNGNWYDLMHGETVYIGPGNFILQAKRRTNNIATGTNLVPTIGIYKFSDGKNIYINKNNCIFDIIGNKVK